MRGSTVMSGAKISSSLRSNADQSGRPDSNQRPPRPKRGALTRLSYAPLPLECTHCVAVRADEPALGDLLEHAAAVVLPAQVGNGGELGGAGQVVPLHRRRVIAVAAVGARLSLLQPEVPLDELGVALALLLDANRLSRSVILRVVAPPAV